MRKEQFHFIEQDGGACLCYTLRGDETPDTVTLPMLLYQKISGVAPIKPAREEGKDCFYYDVTGKIPLRSFLSDTVKKGPFLTFLLSLSKMLMESEEYLLIEENFVFDEDLIFIDEQTHRAECICLPFMGEAGDPRLVEEFLKGLLCNSRFDTTEDCSYVARLIICLNQSDFTLSSLVNTVESCRDVEKREEILKTGSFPKVKPPVPPPSERESAYPNFDIPKLVREKTGEKIEIDKPVFILGKSRAQSDYCIDNGAVSRRHASIVSKNGAFFLVDHDSTNATFINGKRIPANVEVKLANNERIRLADEEFCFVMF